MVIGSIHAFARGRATGFSAQRVGCGMHNALSRDDGPIPDFRPEQGGAYAWLIHPLASLSKLGNYLGISFRRGD